ncbi:MAG: nucleoside deaminase [Acutalibacteraceae bacterium]|nr:nucleoside deaminase [Acutalibacteraceae bacterium]
MIYSENDIEFMKCALQQAKKAYLLGEVPVGAVIVKDNKIISVGHNRRETDNNALSHAETEAIYSACKALGTWRLNDCSMYVTLEPCPMCAGAIINARLKAVYYGASDENAGALGSVINMFDMPFSHRPHIYKGLFIDECSKILSDFFTKVRK